MSRGVKTTEDYFLAGRSLGIFPLTISLAATQLGGGFILGTSREAYSYGYIGLMYVVGVCIGFLLLSTTGIASKLRAFNIKTTAELFEDKYNSILLKKYASLCSVFSLGGIFAAQVIASRTLMIALDVYNPILFTVFWLLVILYTMMGGLKAIVRNDIFQLCLIIAVFVTLFIVDIAFDPAQAWTISFNSFEHFIPNAWDMTRIISVFIMPILYSLIEQDLAQAFFAARNGRVAVLSSFFAAAFLMIFAFIPLYFGMKAKFLGIPLQVNANPLMSFFDATYSPYVVGLVTYGVFAAIISSANAVLCAISGNIVQDFKLAHGSKQLIIAQAVTFIIGCCGLVLGFYFTDLIKILVDSYAIPVCALWVSLLVAYFKEGPLSKAAAYASVITGSITLLIGILLGKYAFVSIEIDALLYSALAYGMAFFVEKCILKNTTTTRF